MIEKTKKLNVPGQKQIRQIKLALIGDCLTGKSTFLHKLLTNQFIQHYQPTLGVETGTKIIQNNNNIIKNVTIWDFSGRIDFLQIRNEFYKQADIILIFIDLSTKNGFDNIDYWIKQAKDDGATILYSIGNKLDNKKIYDGDKISKDKGFNFYFQISSKTGQGIQELIKKIITQFK